MSKINLFDIICGECVCFYFSAVNVVAETNSLSIGDLLLDLIDIGTCSRITHDINGSSSSIRYNYC